MRWRRKLFNNHLVHWYQADNIWFFEWMFRIHIKIPWDQFNAHLEKINGIQKKRKKCVSFRLILLPNFLANRNVRHSGIEQVKYPYKEVVAFWLRQTVLIEIFFYRFMSLGNQKQVLRVKMINQRNKII